MYKDAQAHKHVFSTTRRQLVLLPFALWLNPAIGQNVPEFGSVPNAPTGACPLNSGGPSLLGSRWRLRSVYGNRVPTDLPITMEVGPTSMEGLGGCNTYVARFQQVGNRGFKVLKIERTRKPCEVIRPAPGAPTINVGSWEGIYLRVLGRAGSVEQLGATLQFYDFNGKPSIVFARSYGQRVTQPQA